MTLQLKNKTVLVTGGNGFLGTHVVNEFESLGATVVAPRSSQFNLLNQNNVKLLMSQCAPDVVIHLAARVGGIGANRDHPGSFFYENMMMGCNVIEECRVQNVAKIVVIGTVCSYPGNTPVPFKEDDMWNGYPEPTNAPYGIAKKSLMVMLDGYRREYGVNSIFLVPVNLYGPGDSTDLRSNHVIPAMIRKFIDAKRLGLPFVELWGSGKVSREFLFVKDAAKGICAATQLYDGPDPVNMGVGSEITIHQLSMLIKDLVEYTGDVVYNPLYPDGQLRRCLDTSRAYEKFGWRATTPLHEGLRQTIEAMSA